MNHHFLNLRAVSTRASRVLGANSWSPGFSLFWSRDSLKAGLQRLGAQNLAILAILTWLMVAVSLNAADKITLKVVKVDSEETAGEDGKGANAVDGDPETIWHTQWQDASPVHPHEITIELSAATKLKGFTYLPRQGDTDNGTIKDFEFYVSDDGKEFGAPVAKGTFDRSKEKQFVSCEPKTCRFIKLKALSEINGQPWTSAAEIGIIQEGDKVPYRPTLKVIKVDSEETTGEDGKGANAVDKNPGTFWHTQWQDKSPACPHEIIIELVPAGKIKGFTYLPRQDEGENGTIKDYEFSVSADGQNFGEPVRKGAFERGKEKKTVLFDAVPARFIKLKALSEVNGEAWTSAAEITVVPED